MADDTHRDLAHDQQGIGQHASQRHTPTRLIAHRTGGVEEGRREVVGHGWPDGAPTRNVMRTSSRVCCVLITSCPYMRHQAGMSYKAPGSVQITSSVSPGFRSCARSWVRI